MNKSSILALGLALEAGCADTVNAGHELDRGISSDQCFDNITDNRISLQDQDRVVVNPHDDDAYLEANGEFHEELRLVQEGVDVVLLAAVGNLDGESNTLDIAQTATGTVEEEFGNGSIDRETTQLFTTVDFGDVPSLVDTEIDLVATDPSCTKLYSDVFRYEVSDDYGFETPYVEEQE